MIPKWFVKAALLVGVAGLPSAAMSATIAPGQVRSVEGKVSAVDAAGRAVVVEIPSGKGPLAVGVTLDKSVAPKVAGKPAKLEDVAVGKRARLKYTRKDGELVGLDLNVQK